MEINWTLITYIVIGLFALSGFFKGWWKEAIITLFLGVLIFFLNMPGFAQQVIDRLNSLKITLVDILETTLRVKLGVNAIQVNADNRETWLIILILFIGLAIFISRSGLPNKTGRKRVFNTYPVTPMGGVLGGLLGGLNGFLIMNLIREYLDGRNLPGNGGPSTEITMAGGGSIGTVSSGVSIQATELPNFTILDGYFVWVVIVVGFLLFVAVLRTRGLRGDKTPFGYKEWNTEKEKDPIAKEDKFLLISLKK